MPSDTLEAEIKRLEAAGRRRLSKRDATRYNLHKNDLKRFAHYLGIEKLDDWQEKVLDSKSDRIILNCSRQSGKSTCTAIMAVHHAIFKPNSMVIVISRIEAQSLEVFKRMSNYYKEVSYAPHATEDTSHSLKLSNGSRIIALSGQQPDSLRGYAGVSLLIIDEASRVLEETYNVVRPTLAVSSGRVILLSTPHGRKGFFFESWMEATDQYRDNLEGWESASVTADEIPRIKPSFLKQERKKYPEWFYRQEYMCEFQDNISNIFRSVHEAFEHVDADGEEWQFDIGL